MHGWSSFPVIYSSFTAFIYQVWGKDRKLRRFVLMQLNHSPLLKGNIAERWRWIEEVFSEPWNWIFNLESVCLQPFANAYIRIQSYPDVKTNHWNSMKTLQIPTHSQITGVFQGVTICIHTYIHACMHTDRQTDIHTYIHRYIGT